ncbi:hypothetical protein TL16_g10480 [Triparma laevis f. inornata]|uniref:Uncharacterized protein n=1 Tax=Triparma laevis f. inornata TaxID=1714386 RepID=A0A9W7BHE7_9STRA|nr:hypothetical protein TL16_g10480 [Triparma laevis f. inornata]
MVLTVCIGASGSGKTTFLEDVFKVNKCVYIRQYHNIRPFIVVNKIPNFDPSALPFWNLYEEENVNVVVELLVTQKQQHTINNKPLTNTSQHNQDLLICLDEPFAGVTDDFVPYLKNRLSSMSQNHNVLLVTNDHVQAMKEMAKNSIVVSAIDRSFVSVNDMDKVNREVALNAVSNGNDYVHENSKDDQRFFFEVEVFSLAGGLGAVAGFTVFAMTMLIVSYWDSREGSEALVLVGVQIVAFFCINPYLIALADWRTYMTEESEALLHASVNYNKAMKSTLTLIVLLVISIVAFGVINLCMSVNTMAPAKYFVHMLFDSASLTFPFICVGLYTDLPLQVVQIIASLPFLCMIFFSTTFSPGAGLDGVKFLRFLFARFYFWCDLPAFQDLMEDCPDEGMLVPYTVMSGCLGLFLFLCLQLFLTFKAQRTASVGNAKRVEMENSVEFQQLQMKLFGAQLIKNPSHKKGGENGFKVVTPKGGKDKEGFALVATTGDEHL